MRKNPRQTIERDNGFVDPLTVFVAIPFIFLLIAIIIMAIYPLINHFLNMTKIKSNVTTKMKMRINLTDSYLGSTLQRKISHTVKCPHCHGTAAESEDKMHTCPLCGGEGKTVRRIRVGPFIQQVYQECPRCGGAGYTIDEVCHVCHGHKEIRQEEMIDVHVPKGAKTGDYVIISGKGDHDGDLMILFDVEERQNEFKRKEQDLETTLTISLKEVCYFIVQIAQS